MDTLTYFYYEGGTYGNTGEDGREKSGGKGT